MTLSTAARQAVMAEHSREELIGLLRMSHPEIVGGPVLLSDHPKTRISVNPLAFATFSTWQGTDTPAAEPLQYDFVLVRIPLPSKGEVSAPGISLIAENVDRDMVEPFRQISPDRRHELLFSVAYVLGSDPDIIVEEYRNLRVLRGPIGEATLQFDISHQSILQEPCPCDRKTQSRFPALFR